MMMQSWMQWSGLPLHAGLILQQVDVLFHKPRGHSATTTYRIIKQNVAYCIVIHLNLRYVLLREHTLTNYNLNFSHI